MQKIISNYPRKDFLTAMAIGDAYGMRVEFVEHDCTLTQNDLSYAPHPTFKEYKAGHYTDDTQMSLANAQLLCTGRTVFSDHEFIQGWLDAFARDPRMGYSKNMYRILSEAKTPDDFRTMIAPGQGTTSGSAMRAGVFGVLPYVRTVMALAEQQAKITHNSPAGITAAVAAALGVHFLHYGGRRKQLPSFVRGQLSNSWNSAANGFKNTPDNGLNIVTQAIKVVAREGSLSDTLLRAVNFAPKTDTDTVCALAMATASRDWQTRHDLPETLHDTLESGPFGKAYLQKMDEALMTRYPSKDFYQDYRPAPLRTSIMNRIWSNPILKRG